MRAQSRAAVRASSSVAAVKFMWPILRPRARFVPCRTDAGARPASRRRRSTAACARFVAVEPDIAEEVQHHGRRMLARVAQRHAASSRAPAARTGWWRRHRPCSGRELCGRGAISLAISEPSSRMKNSTHSTPTYPSFAAIVQRGVLRLRDERRGRVGRRHDGVRENAVDVRVLRERNTADCAVAAARDQHRYLELQRHALFEHARNAGQRRIRGAHFIDVAHADLAFAVVAQDARSSGCRAARRRASHRRSPRALAAIRSRHAARPARPRRR